jgi:tetratricopeptide (TPR) repeat protein
VADIGKLATANPAVLSYQQSLVWAHDQLRKLYQRSGEQDKAIASLQQIIRVSDGLSQRNPQNPQHSIASIEAAQEIAEIHRISKKEAETAVILGRVIEQAEPIMRLHPTSNDLLRRLLKAHQRQGSLAFGVEQYEKAQAAYQGGVKLFARYRSSVKPLEEETHYHYLQCCAGLLQIAKEKKETERAIELAGKLIVPIKPETFTFGDYKQTLLHELITLSRLYEDTGNVAEALRLQILVVQEAKKTLKGDPKSNWYVYQMVFGGHQHLARLYRKAGDQRREFESLRNHFSEFETYVSERNHSALLAQTANFTPENLDRLREVYARLVSQEGMKRFTVPVDFNGVKYPFHIFIADSWRFLEDQFTWVEKVRGGKVPREVVISFRRLYRLARDNKISFHDLCVYALGTAGAAGKVVDANPIVSSGSSANLDIVLRELAAAKQELQSGKGGDLARRRLALRYVRLAEDEIGASNHFRAGHLLTTARSHLDVDSFDRLRDPKDSDLFARIQYVQGALLACTGELGKGYSRVLASLQTKPVANSPAEFAIPAGNQEFALGWICLKLQRPAEAALWYRKALELGHNFAAGKLYLVYQQHPESTKALPDEMRKLLVRATTEATKDEPAPAAFARLVRETKRMNELAGPATLASRASQLGEVADQYRLLGEGYLVGKKPEQALDVFRKEEELRAQQIRLRGADDRLRGDHARAIYHVARATLDLGQTALALPLLKKAHGMDSEEATFALAELYEQGKGVAKDPKKAASLRAAVLFARGLRLLDKKKYAEALVEFERSVKELPSLGGHQRIGRCQRKLGRNDEAIASFKKSLALAAEAEGAHWVALDLLETALSANKPDEVFATLALLKKQKWSAAQAEFPHTFERELAGLSAIALHMAGMDAAEAEKKLQEIASRPNLLSLRERNVELDAWLKSSKPSAARQAAVKKILAALAAPARELVSPYYPLKDGNYHIYKTSSSGGGQVTIRVGRREKVGERAYYRLETVVDDKVTESERIAVEPNGICRQSATPPLLLPHLCLLPLSPRGGEKWTIRAKTSPTSWFAAVTGQGNTRVEDVTVPAGQFKGAIVAEVKTRDTNGATVKTVWYVKEIGPVKIVTKNKKGTVVLELERSYLFKRRE